MPNSGDAVLPRLTVPAASSAATSGWSADAGRSGRLAVPFRVGTPARSYRSLSADGRPHNGLDVGSR